MGGTNDMSREEWREITRTLRATCPCKCSCHDFRMSHFVACCENSGKLWREGKFVSYASDSI